MEDIVFRNRAHAPNTLVCKQDNAKTDVLSRPRIEKHGIVSKGKKTN
jgi:hypothetical protein